nr:30S ribosomal protein S16 [Actinoplanes digitatis]
MAVKIRLLRMGKIRNPQYRIVVADSRTKRDGRAIEYVGIYQPKEDPSIIQVKSERVQYWLSVGAQPSEAVQRLLEKTGDWQLFKGLPSPAAAARQGREGQPHGGLRGRGEGCQPASRTPRPPSLAKKAKAEPKAEAKAEPKAEPKAETAEAVSEDAAGAGADGN